MTKTNFMILLSTVLLLLSIASISAFADNSSTLSGEQLKWQVVASGGRRGTSTNMIMYSTVGQAVYGHGTGGSFKLNSGFQQNFTVDDCTSCGDADGSGGAPDISDAVFLIAYIFGGGPAPGPCGTNPNGLGDADASGGAPDISDAVFLIAYIFGGGPAPHCP